jgi:hypothetical protein
VSHERKLQTLLDAALEEGDAESFFQVQSLDETLNLLSPSPIEQLAERFKALIKAKKFNDAKVFLPIIDAEKDPKLSKTLQDVVWESWVADFASYVRKKTYTYDIDFETQPKHRLQTKFVFEAEVVTDPAFTYGSQAEGQIPHFEERLMYLVRDFITHIYHHQVLLHMKWDIKGELGYEGQILLNLEMKNIRLRNRGYYD